MPAIIRQNPKSLPFPDLRNLGTIARILIGANVLIAIGALVRAPSFSALPEEWVDSVALGEFYVLLQLVLLYALGPWLRRLSFAAGSAVVLAATVAAGLVTDGLLRRVVPLPEGSVWRYLLFGLIVAGALLFYLQLRAKALSPALIEARLQALQARIRPHFLFNSINAVLSLVRAEPKRAEHALEDLADLFRVLMSDNRDLVPLGDEVELCRQYLALESLRLGDRLRIEWHLNSMPADALVPPLVLQPLIENAVYHGIEPLSEPGVLSVNIFAKDGQVHAILRNPYRVEGGRHHAGNKMAYDNVRERLALHFDAEGSLVSSVKDASYEVHIRMPYRPAGGRASAAAHAGAAQPGRERGPALPLAEGAVKPEAAHD
jgi:two-component system sensor histidine kinase AlgZ